MSSVLSLESSTWLVPCSSPQVLSLHELPAALPLVAWRADPLDLLLAPAPVDPPTVDDGLQGVPGHVYAHVLASRVRSGRLSIDASDQLVEAVAAASAEQAAQELTLGGAAVVGRRTGARCGDGMAPGTAGIVADGDAGDKEAAQ